VAAYIGCLLVYVFQCLAVDCVRECVTGCATTHRFSEV